MRKLMLSLSLALLILVSALGALVHRRADSPSATQVFLDTVTPTSPSPYDPAQYGVPDVIAGYKVLAVLTADNVACMTPGSKRLVLQSTQPDEEGYLAHSDPAAIRSALEGIGLAGWEIQIVGPGATLEGISSEIQRWNQGAQSHGCIRSSPIVPIDGSNN